MPLKTTAGNHGEPAKGRGSPANPEGRFEKWARDAADDGWFQEAQESDSRPKTVVAIERAKSIISRNDSPDVGFTQSINPYRGCEHGCGYCIWGGTPVLMADGRTRALSELKRGDEIYGTRRVGAYRRYVRSRVLDHWSSIKPAFRVALEDGTELVTSGDHRFLTERGWKHVSDARPLTQRPHLTLKNKLMGTGAFVEAERETDDYRRGYLCGMLRGDAHMGVHECVRSNGRHTRVSQFRLALCDPEALLRSQDYLLDFEIVTSEYRFQAAQGNRREMNAIATGSASKLVAVRSLIAWPTASSKEWAAGFLSGIFDAEGSFSQTVLRISNSDHQIIGWICTSLRSLGFQYAVEDKKTDPKLKPMKVVRLVGGLREHLRFFHTVRPAITRKLNLEGQAIKSDAKLRVVAIEPLGKAMRLYDITTETGDFIANGVVSHNCYARPSHAYLGLSPGLDFETRLFAKTNAAELLREELAKPSYRCSPIAIGVNTDAYQPIEREHRITRSILEVVHEAKQPVFLITKSALVERDIDILAAMAKERLVGVTLSVTTLDNEVSRRMEPRTSAPARRLKAIERLAAAGIPVSVNVAPVVPFLTDFEMEPILEAAAQAGATSAGYQLMRLPWEVKDIFKAWLEEHFPLKAAHVMSRVREMREGRENDPDFGSRMSGTGLFAELLRKRFEIACARYGYHGRDRDFRLETGLFRPPSPAGQQRLF